MKELVTNDNVRFLTFLVLGFLFLVIFEYEIVRPRGCGQNRGKTLRLGMSDSQKTKTISRES